MITYGKVTITESPNGDGHILVKCGTRVMAAVASTEEVERYLQFRLDTAVRTEERKWAEYAAAREERASLTAALTEVHTLIDKRSLT